MTSKFGISPCEDSGAFAPWEGRAVLLVDLDAFYASVEQRDHPEWRGRPLIVGGDAHRHGVVSTCSYEARKYGVHSAMPASQADRLCPDAIWVPGRHSYYEEVSAQIMGILRDETPVMQQVSIDEAFLDVTNTRVNREHPAAVASRIQRRVREEVGVTCSVGIGTSKTVAKIASDCDKPFGLTMVAPGREREFLDPLPIRAMSGVGAASEARLRRFGIKTLRDLACAEESIMRDVFGKNADMMRARARGEDVSAVSTEREVKSVSGETTFADCLTERADLAAAMATMASKVGRRMRAKGLVGSTAQLKVRFESRQVKSVQRPLAHPTNDNLEIQPVLLEMLDEVWAEGTPVRLIGVGLSHLQTCDEAEHAPVQLSLADLLGGEDASAAQPDAGGVGTGTGARTPEGAAGIGVQTPGAAAETDMSDLDAFASRSKREKLLAATDAVRDRFGGAALKFGHEMRNAGNTTGTIPK